MKKALFLISACTISISAFSQGGYLPNSGFESWTTNTIYENPDLWGSSNYENGNPVVNVTKSTDAQHLTSSILLQNTLVNNGQDTSFAYTYLGVIGSGGPDAGVPYSASVNQINGYYKGTIGANDTAQVLVIKFLAGNPVSLEIFPIFTSQTNFTAFTFNISPLPQDSIFIGLLSSNPFVFPTYANPNTSIKFDNISLSHSISGPGPALPNFSFENWTPILSETPNGWTTYNDALAVYGVSNVNKSTDFHAGSFAAELSTLPVLNDTLPGLLVYGELDANMDFTALPYNASPVALEGFYKYSTAVLDQASVAFEFYSNGTVVGANQMALTPTANYLPFSLNTNITSTPDSLIIVFYSGDHAGSFLVVDDVQFTGGDLSVNPVFDFDFAVYPNPSSDFIQISGNMNGMYQISIQDMSGKMVFSESKSTRKSELDIRHLPTGMYSLTIETNGHSISRNISVIR